MRRVVVTGLGIVSSIGNNAQEVLESLKSGRSGITANAADTVVGSANAAKRDENIFISNNFMIQIRCRDLRLQLYIFHTNSP